MTRHTLFGATAAALSTALLAPPVAAHAGHGEADPVTTGLLHGLLGADHTFGAEELGVIAAIALVVACGVGLRRLLRARPSAPAG